MSIYTSSGMNAHPYHIVGLSMIDAEDRYGSEGRYWRFGCMGAGMAWHALHYLYVFRPASLKNQNVKGFCHESHCIVLAAGACELHIHRRLGSVFTKPGLVE